MSSEESAGRAAAAPFPPASLVPSLLRAQRALRLMLTRAAAILAISGVALSACAGAPSATPPSVTVIGQAPTGPTTRARVVAVVDGDTIRVAIGAQVYRVRYIGIDAPETVDPRRPVGLLGPQASAANRSLVEGQEVVLEKDVSETDRYGRLLRYVWLQKPGGWLLVNLELLRRGLATVTTYPPDVKYVDALYLPAQRAARSAGVGLWGPNPASFSAPGQRARRAHSSVTASSHSVSPNDRARCDIGSASAAPCQCSSPGGA
ncbi:MAG: thermonuclease family protein [Candidatus Limnocylindria bacterium]